MRRHEPGRYASIVVVAEGAVPKPRARWSVQIAERRPTFGHEPPRRHRQRRSPAEIEARTGFETRVTILGHVQRGGTPTAFDRVLATRFGVAAIDAVHDGAFGSMVALRGGEIVRVPLIERCARGRTLVDAGAATAWPSVFFG